MGNRPSLVTVHAMGTSTRPDTVRLTARASGDRRVSGSTGSRSHRPTGTHAGWLQQAHRQALRRICVQLIQLHTGEARSRAGNATASKGSRPRARRSKRSSIPSPVACQCQRKWKWRGDSEPEQPADEQLAFDEKQLSTSSETVLWLRCA